MATLLFDLLTEQEDLNYETRFDIPLLTQRLIAVTHWIKAKAETRMLKVAYFGASTGEGLGLDSIDALELVVARSKSTNLAYCRRQGSNGYRPQ